MLLILTSADLYDYSISIQARLKKNVGSINPVSLLGAFLISEQQTAISAVHTELSSSNIVLTDCLAFAPASPTLSGPESFRGEVTCCCFTTFTSK